MRKFIYLLTIALLIVLLVITNSVNDIGMEYIYTNDYVYQINPDDSITLIEFLNADEIEEVTIPSFIDSHQVKCIGEKCFDCSSISAITINDNIVTVKKEAFINCENLSYLSVPADLDCHGKFIGLTDLKTLKITYGDNGFMFDYSYEELPDWHDSCSSITSLIFDDTIRYLGDFCFSDLVNLENIELNCSIESIGMYCFYNTTNLSELDFDLSLRSIKERSFSADEDVEVSSTILIPQSVEYFGKDCLDARYDYIVYKDSKAQSYLDENNIDYSLLDLSFTKEINTLALGDSHKVEIVDQSLNDQLTYSSSDQQVATVDEHGNITTNSVGIFTLTVRSDAASNCMQIEVVNDEEEATEVLYRTIRVTDSFTINNKDFNRFVDKNDYSYYLSNGDVLVETSDNSFKAIDSGSCKVYLTDGNDTVYYYVNVVNMIKDISLNEEIINLKKGSTNSITVDFDPSNADNKSLTYSSSDEKIAIVDRFGKITALSEGSCSIYVSTNDGSNITKEMSVTVSSASIECEVDAFPLLVDKYYRLNCSCSNGDKLLYRSSNEKIATVDKNGIVFAHSAGLAYITVFNEKRTAYSVITVKVYDGYSYGIDISEWNGRYHTTETFKKIKQDGIDFVYMRAAHGDDYQDPTFENNYQNAKKAGLEVGAYHFIISDNAIEAKKEAKWMISVLEGKQFEYPIMVDVEAKVHKSLSTAEITSIIQAYCDTLKEAGYYPIVYSYGSILSKNKTDYDNWIAQWDSERVTTIEDYSIWQFTSKGIVNGLSGDVDLDICFIDYPTFIKENHYNGY